jgi:tetratricopeptide (TPR) repeat protein
VATVAPRRIANVVAMRSTRVGDYIYRVSQPSAALGRIPGVSVVTVGVLSPHLADVVAAADVLVLHLLTEDDLFPLVAQRRRRGAPTVYEISDNFLAGHDGVGIRGWFADALNRSNAQQLIHLADGVQVTGAGLAQRFCALNPRLAVFENMLERVGRPPPAPQARVRLGWAGSLGHTEDLRAIAPVLARVCQRFPQVHFAFMGSEDQFTEVFGGLPVSQRSHTPPGSLDDYYRFLSTLDVGLAPMLPNAFNQCRSDVKFLEYAAHGVVPVLFAITPYLQHAEHRRTALLYRDASELEAGLGELVEAPELRAEIAQRAWDYVRTNRLEGQHAGARLAFYETLRPPMPSVAWQGLALSRSAEDSECYDVVVGAAENAVVAGIQALGQGDDTGAWARLELARREEPRWHLPLFWQARARERGARLDEAVALLRAALELSPASLRAALHLARLLATREPGAARAVLERAHALAPEHAPTLEALGQLAEEAGDWAAALRHYEAALGASPYLGRLATRMGRLCAQLGQHTLARELHEHAAGLEPLDVEGLVGLAEHLADRGEVERAAQHCVRAVELEPGNARGQALLRHLIALMETRAPSR